jgi:hypothetical protein
MADDGKPDPEWAAAVDYMLRLIGETGRERSQEAAREIAMRFGITSDMMDAALAKLGLSGSAVARTSATGWFGPPGAAMQGQGVLAAGGTVPAAAQLHGEGTLTVSAVVHVAGFDVGSAADEVVRVDVTEDVDSLLDRARRHGTELLAQDEVYRLALFVMIVVLLLVITPAEQHWIEDKVTLGGIAWGLADLMMNRTRKK